MSQSTRIHGPAANAPRVTNEYAVCQVCGVQWQVQSANHDDARACAFCGAGEEAISIYGETPDYRGEGGRRGRRG